MMKTLKKTITWILVIGILAALFPAGAEDTAGIHPGQIILYTAYRQMGWGDAIQIGCVDEDGACWTREESNADLKWPYRPEEQIAWITGRTDLTCVGKLTSDERFDLEGLINCAEKAQGEPVSAADDAGTETSYAVRYSWKTGTAEFILLGMSGDDLYENTGENAQALYRVLRVLFPGVTSYAYQEYMGPKGFTAVPLGEFCGWNGADLEHAVITAAYEDCETGFRKVELDAETENRIRSLAMNGMVTGKANCTFTTGGTTYYWFKNAEGETIATFGIYHGLLTHENGMYFIE